MLYNICYWWFILSQGNRWTKRLAHPKIRRSKPCLLMFASLVVLDGSYLPLSAQLTSDLTRVKWWIYVSSIVTYLCKNCFLLRWNSRKQRSESSTRCFWSTVTKRDTHFEHSFLSDKCSCKMVNTLPSDTFNSPAISRNFKLQSTKTSLWSFFGVFQVNCRIWATWAFSIICICTTAFNSQHTTS